MKAEIVAVGTELLLGQIVNTNARFLARQLAEIGVDSYFQTVVGDNLDRIVQALTIASQRADLVICTGGLGPTRDDLTKDAIAAWTGRRLIYDEPALSRIERFFRERGVPMAESNARQALIPEGCDPLPNDNGLAVGAALEHGGVRYIVLPGPPKELEPMFVRYARPWILAQMPQHTPLHSVVLKFAGIGESALEQKLIDLIDGQSEVTLAPYAGDGEVAVRVSVKASDQEQAMRKMSGTLADIRRRLGEHLYAEEDIPLEEAVVRQLKARGLLLSAAESCTGGLFAERITSVPGSSAVFAGAMIAYTNEFKIRHLGVPERLLSGDGAPGAISEQTARAMAERARELTGSHFALSFTGAAGPDPSEGKGPGLVYIGLASDRFPTETYRLQWNGDRHSVRLRAVRHGLYVLWRKIGRE